MDRITQTAIMAAAMGAVVVTAGVVISFQTKLEQKAATENAAVEMDGASQTFANEATPEHRETPVTNEAEPAEATEDELDLSEFGRPMHDTSLFNPDSSSGGAQTEMDSEAPADAPAEDSADEAPQPAQEQTANEADQNEIPSAAQTNSEMPTS